MAFRAALTLVLAVHCAATEKCGNGACLNDETNLMQLNQKMHAGESRAKSPAAPPPGPPDESVALQDAEETQWHNQVMDAWESDPECADVDLSTCGMGMIFVDVDTQANGKVDVATHDYYRRGGKNAKSANKTWQGEMVKEFGKNQMHEIASNSKVFAAVLMQALVDEGAITYDYSVGDDMATLCENDHSISVPKVVKDITVFELAAYTSGLPAQPWNRKMAETEQTELPLDKSGKNARGEEGFNPFFGYTEKDLCEFLAEPMGRGVELKNGKLPSKGKFLYSNVGYGLLGYMLEKKMGISYGTLSESYIFGPLKMTDTKILSPNSPEWETRVLKGTMGGNMSPQYRGQMWGVLRGNGAFHSTLGDMAKFLTATILAQQGDNQPISKALRNVLLPVAWDIPCIHMFCEDMGWAEGPSFYRTKAALGWSTFSHGGEIGWDKAGDTEGYSSFMAILPNRNGHGASAAYAYDTCAGCGAGRVNGAAGEQGSAVQRLVHIVLGGPEQPIGNDAPLGPNTAAMPHGKCGPESWCGQETTVFPGTYEAYRLLGSEDEKTKEEIPPAPTDAPRQKLVVGEINADGKFPVMFDGIDEPALGEPIFSYDNRFPNQHPIRLRLTGFIGSSGGGPHDVSPLAVLKQRRELIFIPGGAGPKPEITQVALVDGGKDSFFYNFKAGLKSVLPPSEEPAAKPAAEPAPKPAAEPAPKKKQAAKSLAEAVRAAKPEQVKAKPPAKAGLLGEKKEKFHWERTGTDHHGEFKKVLDGDK